MPTNREDCLNFNDEDSVFSDVFKTPLFIKKENRQKDKNEHQAALNQEIERLQQTEQQEIDRILARSMMIDVIRTEESNLQQHMAGDSDGELPDDTDDFDESEYEMWKLREIDRLKRDENQRMARFHEQEEIEQRRNMTEAERQEDDARFEKEHKSKEKSKNVVFMQKYYHSGAFFQDVDEDLYKRDSMLPTESDLTSAKAFSETGLNIFKVRRGDFNQKGRSKWTHLADQDTTDKSSAWGDKNSAAYKIRQRLLNLNP